MKERVISTIAVVAAFAAAVLLLAALSGCQSVTRVEYYEPSAGNAAYCPPRSATTQGHGPVKSIEGKSGVPDFSDNKTFKWSFSFFGL